MFLALDGVHVEHVHAVLHTGPGAGVAHCPAHHARHAPLPELGEELGVEVHSAGCLLRESVTTSSRNIGKTGICRILTWIVAFESCQKLWIRSQAYLHLK